MDRGREIKVVLLGEAGVGKSSIVLRFVTDHFKAYSEATIGASFMSKTILVDGVPCKMDIWDTAGQEKYRGLAPMYYRGAAAAIVVYDVTKKSSMNTLKNWVKELHTLGPENIVIVVAGNKADMEDGKREVPENTGRTYAKEIGAEFWEVSAKTGQNIIELFQCIGKELPEGSNGQREIASIGKSSSNLVLSAYPDKPAKKRCC